ncbi:hypothetical protein [Sphingomonas sp. G-3-2-10]|jgi:hypothetical protein|uniref:hypothetical protein n=1 Tax=Sphingomonas sp. G-3-2-10 TaxID=2728838 RepID=UPI00146BD90D|nr:hypothetical protein [Sphingomonas sp. G-3-2-10]NML06584.1 hypothetical protein [Sphingomonas sp. G-3-2-10]
MRAFALLLIALPLAACGGATGEIARPARAAGPVPIPVTPTAMAAGLDRVHGQPAARLIATFGKPQIDLTEGAGRKLQFAGPICVLDAYLYPKGRNEAVVTHIDARQRDGSPIDPASCVAALQKQ